MIQPFLKPLFVFGLVYMKHVQLRILIDICEYIFCLTYIYKAQNNITEI